MTAHLTRTFGVELELLLPEGSSRAALAAALQARGIDAEAQAYNHRRAAVWKIVPDGSLSSEARGAEVVSPVLTGEAGLDLLDRVCEALQDFGCTVDRSCGYHVHVGARSMQLPFFKSLAKIYSAFEPIIDGIMPASRRASNNSFCRTITHASRQQIDNCDSISALIRTIAHDERYSKLNFASHARHGTVEFRQHSGTLDAKKARMWVVTCLRMVQAAATADPFQSAAPTTAIRNTARPGSKRHTIVSMILRPTGASRSEIVSATNWPSVSIAQIAASTGIPIVTERRGRETHYRVALAAAAPAPTDISISLDGLCSLIQSDADEREYLIRRTANLAGGAIQWAA